MECTKNCAKIVHAVFVEVVEYVKAKVSAVKHVEYINREGNFAHDQVWQQSNKFVGNFITTKDTPNTLNGLNELQER